MSGQQSLPSDLVEVGYVSGAFGLQGWVRIHPYSSTAGALLEAKEWWLAMPAAVEPVPMQRLSSKHQGEDVVAKLAEVVDRSAAEKLKGALVKVSRSDFPTLTNDEFYWLDLIGLVVLNLQGDRLGTVRGLMDNGAHPILRVADEPIAEQDLSRHERLIPFVEHFVKVVDQAAGVITVDWGLDF
jgi:16S rRNA processing protein RimM